MKNLILIGLTAFTLAGTVYAGGGCCGTKQKEEKKETCDKKDGSCEKAECSKGSCSTEKSSGKMDKK